MHYLGHLLECGIGPSLKVVQLRRLFDWTNMAAALPQFFDAARHPCVEVSVLPYRFFQGHVKNLLFHFGSEPVINVIRDFAIFAVERT